MTITIKHLEGPLKGTEATFDDSYDAVLFGRDREVAQVVYPPEYDVIGRRHFELRRTPAGDYTVELFGTRYVEIDGKPADNGTPVKSGSTFRLGRKEGPVFTVEIGAPSAIGLPVTGKQEEMITSTERLGRKVAIGGGVFALLLIGVVGYLTYLQTSLADQIALARAEAAARAAKEFSPATLETLEKAVYLVAKDDGGADKAEGTAWAFAPGQARHQRPRHRGDQRQRGRVLPDRSRRQQDQDREGDLPPGLSRLQELQGDPRHDTLG